MDLVDDAPHDWIDGRRECCPWLVGHLLVGAGGRGWSMTCSRMMLVVVLDVFAVADEGRLCG